MKFVKKLTALFLAVCMVMAMGITAFAEGENSGTTGGSSETATQYTISVDSNDDHTYVVYQILKGKLSTNSNNEKVLSDVEAGKNFNSKNNAKKSGGNLTAAEAAEYLSKVTATTDQGKLKEILKFVNVTTDSDDSSVGFGTVTKNESLKVDPGYYLIKDVSKSLDNKDDAYSTYITAIVDNTTINRKATKPTIEKKVKDKNDTTNKTTDWQDAADHDLNDAIDFKITVTLGNSDNFADYEHYALTIHDQQSAGLTFNNNGKLYYVEGDSKTQLSTNSFHVDYSSAKKQSDGCTFEVVIGSSYQDGSDIKYDAKKVYKYKEDDSDGDAVTVKEGGKFVYEYTSTLNGNAVMGSTGNPNETWLDYSNNPNGEGTGTTSHDKVIVFTYQVIAEKVNENQQPDKKLADAEFSLYKGTEVTEGTSEAESYNGGYYTWTQVGGAIKVSKGADDKYTSAFQRVDDGVYKLVESKVPTGYNKADDVIFEISADHSTTNDNPLLNTIGGGTLGDGVVDTGAVSTQVINKPGSTLPETGGMGTTVIYIAGIALIVAAGVVVIARKRMA